MRSRRRIRRRNRKRVNDMKKLGIILATCIIAVVAVVLIRSSVRSRKLEENYSKAYSGLSYPDAVRDIESSKDKEAPVLLLRIAMNAEAATPNRVAAIEALSRRGTADAAIQIPNLLRSSETFPIRLQAADFIQRRECKGKCVEALLSYLKAAGSSVTDDPTSKGTP